MDIEQHKQNLTDEDAALLSELQERVLKLNALDAEMRDLIAQRTILFLTGIGFCTGCLVAGFWSGIVGCILMYYYLVWNNIEPNLEMLSSQFEEIKAQVNLIAVKIDAPSKLKSALLNEEL